MSAETLDAADELDLSGDSAVEIVESIFTITDATEEETSSDNGSGARVNLVFESDDVRFPITVRFFTAYEPTDSTKNTDWVARQRGQLKNVVKAATGEARLNTKNPDADNYIVGKQVRATTKDGGDGFATLGKFKKVA